MIIQHNVTAMNSHRQLFNNNMRVAKNLEKLSSGYKINRAGDDAAGLGISEKMRAQIKGLETTTQNAKDGISLIQTAEGALTEVHSMLNRMVELATKSANGTYGQSERDKVQDELNALVEDIDRISEGTNFNGTNLLDGSLSKRDAVAEVKKASLEITVATLTNDKTGEASVKLNGRTIKWDVKADGTNKLKDNGVKFEDAIKAAGLEGKFTIDYTTGGTVKITAAADGKARIKDFKVTGEVATAGTPSFTASTDAGKNGIVTKAKVAGAALKLQIGDTNDEFNKISVDVKEMSAFGLGVDFLGIATQEDAGEAISVIKSAIETVSKTRSDMGALQNRLDHVINNLGVATENMTDSESRIRDVDMAHEMMVYTKNNILTQAAQAMLAQANQLPQGVLQLLR